MEQNPQREPTPEERLFKIIQESEEAKEKDDTLIVSSTKPSEPEPAAPQSPVFEDESVKLGQFAEKLEAHPAAVALDEPHSDRPGRRFALPSFQSLQGARLSKQFFRRFATVKLVNHTLAGVLGVLMIYFLTNQVFTKESPSADFLRRANAMSTPNLELPPNLFNMQEVNQGVEVIANRNAFQPWKPPVPKVIVATGPVIPAGLMQSVVPNLKLTGIYFGEQPEALIEAVDEQRTYTVSKDDKIKGIIVKEVKPDGVVLTDGAADHFLQ
ncbi:MAG: hypothetical protein HY592_02050 [Candidatus Omnitrophica bacterium]|nr:hypothetical protein [Candidatus Omnitrophota bacterium]